MERKTFGGNDIYQFGAEVTRGNCLFAEAPYRYYTLSIAARTHTTLSHSSCLIFFQTGKEAKLVFDGKSQIFQNGDAFFSNGKKVAIETSVDSLFYIVADEKPRSAEAQLVVRNDLKVVTKPWGSETWINHPTHDFSLKKIFIKTGTKTSLQYHQFKTETNVLFDGKAKLTYKSKASVSNDSVSTDDLDYTLLNTGDVLHVTPSHIHRLEAISDLTLLEASTNHLDDVIRLQDDFLRQNGRIESEHAKR